MSQQTTHEQYYVPDQSKWPIIATIALLVTFYGTGSWFNDLKAARDSSNGPLIFFVGALLIAYMMFGWFGAVVKESRAGLYSAQMDRSFRWGMSWFIFSEVMFFLAFFGALFYIRYWTGPGSPARATRASATCSGPASVQLAAAEQPRPEALPGAGGHHQRLGPAADQHHPAGQLQLHPDTGAPCAAQEQSPAPEDRPGPDRAARRGIPDPADRGYVHAYTELGLTLGSGIYGATFFMLTGFHGAHVTMGAIILTVMLVRILRGHFSPEQHFGFEAAAGTGTSSTWCGSRCSCSST